MNAKPRELIHRHIDKEETVVCQEGEMIVVFYAELPNMDAGGPVHDGSVAMDETCFKEIARVLVCSRDKEREVRIPAMVWHRVVESE